MRTKYLILTLIAFASVFTACNQTEFNSIPLERLTTSTPWTKTYTFAQLIADYTTPMGIYPDSTRKNSGSLGLYTVDTIPCGGTPIIISGKVISADMEGNIYKSITIQEPETGMGLKLSVDVSGSSAVYPVGQSVNVKCNGLAIGKYAGMFQLGKVYYNVAYSRKDNVTIDTLKTGYEIGRIEYLTFKDKVQMVGMPEPEKIKVDTVSISQILKSSGNPADDNYYHSRIICVKNAYFTGFDGDGKVIANPNDMIFAPSTMGFGYPQSRQIRDLTGSISVSTSEYAKFAAKPIPVSKYVGNITAIVGWYRDKEKAAGSWQLTLRSLGDLGKGYEGYLKEINYKGN